MGLAVLVIHPVSVQIDLLLQRHPFVAEGQEFNIDQSIDPGAVKFGRQTVDHQPAFDRSGTSCRPVDHVQNALFHAQQRVTRLARAGEAAAIEQQSRIALAAQRPVVAGLGQADIKQGVAAEAGVEHHFVTGLVPPGVQPRIGTAIDIVVARARAHPVAATATDIDVVAIAQFGVERSLGERFRREPDHLCQLGGGNVVGPRSSGGPDVVDDLVTIPVVGPGA